ncbi:MAG: ECF transporter S component [Clostridiales bacterium]|jgi:hypothetical protein|nr:ECF transporter S component [Eubacteriales bacterium]MDH7564943.1 ECF transporter S component [Clostridiales bacterium]
MKSVKVRFIARTAILAALTLVFQSLGRFVPLGPNSNFIVGPLVNACLLIATATVGVWGGIIIAAIAPVGSLLTTHSPIASFLLPFSPFVAAGNIVLVLCFYFLLKKSKIAGIILGAVLKFGVLFGSVSFFLVVLKMAPKLAGTLYFLFGWPQLVTALVGGAIALIVLRALGKSVEMNG